MDPQLNTSNSQEDISPEAILAKRSPPSKVRQLFKYDSTIKGDKIPSIVINDHDDFKPTKSQREGPSRRTYRLRTQELSYFSTSNIIGFKSVSKSLPTLEDYLIDQSGPEGDKYTPQEFDEAGEKKVTSTGHLLNGREYICRTFCLPNRGDDLFMLSAECAKVLGFGFLDLGVELSYLYIKGADVEYLIRQKILPYSSQPPDTVVFTAKSVFRQFGSRAIVNGKPVVDDYWEERARKQKSTTEDIPSPLHVDSNDITGAARPHSPGLSKATLPKVDETYQLRPEGSRPRDCFSLLSSPFVGAPTEPSLHYSNQLRPEKLLVTTKATNVAASEPMQPVAVFSSKGSPSDVKDGAARSNQTSSNSRQNILTDAKTLIPASSRILCNPSSQHSTLTLSSDFFSNQDASEDETEYSTDEVSDSHYSSDYLNLVETRKYLNLLKPIMSTSKQILVGRVMEAFWKAFEYDIKSFQNSRSSTDCGQNTEQSTPAQISDSGESSTNTTAPTLTPSSAEGSTNSSNIFASCNKKGKQKRNRDDDDDDGSGGDDRDRDPKRPKKLLSPPIIPDDKNKFSCPYRKNNPRKYCGTSKQWRSCALTPLENVARVKGHLYRHHMIHPCPRCKTSFKSQEEVVCHLKGIKGCELQDIEIGDGITNEIVEQLKSKKKICQGETEGDRWRRIYILLFPGGKTPSPYFELPNDSTELEQYEQFCRRELPRLVRASIEGIISRETQPLEDQIMSQLESIIIDAQHQVYERYRSECASNNTNQDICNSISSFVPGYEPSNTLEDFQNEQPGLSISARQPNFSRFAMPQRQNNVPSTSANLSQPQTSTEPTAMDAHSSQVDMTEAFQPGENRNGMNLLQDKNNGEASSLNDTLDLGEDAVLVGRHDILDPNDYTWASFGDEGSNNFEWGNFISTNSFGDF